MERGRKRRSNGEMIVSKSERREIMDLSSIEIGSRRGIGERRGMIEDGSGIESERLNGPGVLRM